MTKPTDMNWDQAEETYNDEKSFDGVSGIFVATYTMSNMEMDRFIISAAAVERIVHHTQIPRELQSEATANLVDRTPEWEDLDENTQYQKIITALTQETVKQFLIHQGYIEHSDMMENGVDTEGSIILYNYRIQMSRADRRAQANKRGAKGRQAIAEQMNRVGRDGQQIELVKLAQAKMEEQESNGKVVSLDKHRKS